MKKYLNHPIVSLNQASYLTLIIFLSPLLNFLGGINVDIYAPSMPAVADYFSATIVQTKNTITVTLFGWALGALFFGALIDGIGRKRTLCFGLLAYITFSVLAVFCHSIEQLMVVRFLQGFVVSTITVTCRALIIDNISGPRYAIAILYTSLGYGLGPIVGPFIGSVLQHYFGWQANFIALGVCSSLLLSVFFLFIRESIPQRQSLVITVIIRNYLSILRNKHFFVGGVISGLTQIQIMLYPTLGPFIVQDVLHYSALTYGRSALVVGGSYLAGNVLGRLLLKYCLPKTVCDIGFVVLVLAAVLSYVFSWSSALSLWTVTIPLIVLCISGGLVFPTVLGNNLRQFPNNVGVAMAIQASLVLFSSALGVFIVSHIHVVNLFALAHIVAATVVLELGLFILAYRKDFKKV